MPLPLSDVRVLSLEQYGAGPYGSLHLADLGAEVIKIEEPGAGEIGRHIPPGAGDNDSLFFQSFNRNKKSIGLDVAKPLGREVFEDLVRVSDGVYSNLRGDVPARLRLLYDDLAHLNPLVVCCSLSGYGQTGPLFAEPGFDYMVQGHAGWMSLTGEPDGPPQKTGLSVVDFSTGLVAALSLVVGIHQARRDGKGADCDVSLLDTAISMLNYVATWQLSIGYEINRVARSGHPTIVPFGNFRTRDGWIVAGGSKEKFWQRMATIVGRPELLDDPRFASYELRNQHRDELVGLLEEALAARTTADWLRLFREGGVPCAPVNDVKGALADEQVRARGLVFDVDHPAFGKVGQVASPVRVGDARVAHRRAPRLGEDTERILMDLLGYTDREVARLIEAKVIALPSDPSPAG